MEKDKEGNVIKDKHGNDVMHPQPFDIITAEDVLSGKCVPRCLGTPEEKRALTVSEVLSVFCNVAQV